MTAPRKQSWRERAALILMIPIVIVALAWQVLTGVPEEDDRDD